MNATATILIALLTRPRRFFAGRFQGIPAGRAGGILMLSALFFAIAGSRINTGGFSPAAGCILFVNAVGMTLMGCAISYLALAATAGRRYPFSRLWNIYSLSSGAVLLIAWVPSAFLFTEPWKWWLVAVGMIDGLGMSRARAVIVVLFTFGAMAAIVYGLLPVVA